MNNENILSLQGQAQIAAAQDELLACNSISSGFGLSLSEAEAWELAVCRVEALEASGRVEFGGGIVPKIIYAFCDSPYIEQEDYEVTLAALQESFYYFKTEAMERFSDDELIEFMLEVFNGPVHGSAEYLIGTSLEELVNSAKKGYDLSAMDSAGDLL